MDPSQLDPIYNEAALCCYSHSQLKHLCINRGVDARGNSTTLRARLRALREEPAQSQPDESFDIIDNKESNNDNSAVYTDELGVLTSTETASGPSIPKSASWNNKLSLKTSRIFGTSSLSGLTASSSSGSLSSLSSNNTVTCSTSRSTQVEDSAVQQAATLQPTSTLEGGLPPTPYLRKLLSDEGPALEVRKAKASSTSTATYTDTTVILNDTSYAPRRSFEDDSMALEGVPVWPPRPGVILVSPRQSPGKRTSTVPATAPSSSKKRRLGLEDEIIEEGEENADSTMNCGIRLLPRETPLSPGAAALSPIRADGRRISNLPKQYSEIARSPPRFDAEAPPLPSLAGVMSGISSNGARKAKDEQQEAGPRVPGAFVGSTNGSEDAIAFSSDKKNVPPMFVFGSPAQKQVSKANFSDAIDRLASPCSANTIPHHSTSTSTLPPTVPLPAVPSSSAASANEAASWNDVNALQTVWAQLQARSGTEGSVPLPDERKAGDIMARPAGLKRADSTTRFQDLHEKQFAKSDSIANHYAAKRGFVPNKKTRVEEENTTSSTTAQHRPAPASQISSTSSSSSLSTVRSNAEGLHPVIPRKPSTASLIAHPNDTSCSALSGGSSVQFPAPQPRPAKTSAQQKAGADRIKAYTSNSNIPRASPRKNGLHNKPGGTDLRRVPVIPSKKSSSIVDGVAGQERQITKSTSTSSLASKIFKNPFGSLSSTASSASLASKASNGTIESLASQGTSNTQRSTSNSSFSQRPASTYEAGSYRRPTVASINRLNSILSLRPTASSTGNSLISPPIASPHRNTSQMKDYFTQDEKNAIADDYKLPEKDAQIRQQPSSALRQASRISTSSQANQSPAKRRLAAQRNAILGKEDIHHARKIRAKRDHARVKQVGSQYDTSTSTSSASASAANSALSSPNKSANRDSSSMMAGTSSSSANNNAVSFSSGRDRWR